ncbi:uncharacterized protein PADG_12114 [Paracoccidioides brasiliensis Pb18]|uniref:Uncharacterized protein n=1 Tax=Paracoccidioides brasiliensis (strain Pb18) TaxID=502780 RepID=A0A0A0HRI6_PARBD|nr:uncharacterized protein PADG_12114 [Paracoccidioides brasiliensis Pb18]KGM91799.1 hypothetical protein PADG_12114 [Paracoccidioides brasiliensis Pb18]
MTLDQLLKPSRQSLRATMSKNRRSEITLLPPPGLGSSRDITVPTPDPPKSSASGHSVRLAQGWLFGTRVGAELPKQTI